jgi:hypothetical protein
MFVIAAGHAGALAQPSQTRVLEIILGSVRRRDPVGRRRIGARAAGAVRAGNAGLVPNLPGLVWTPQSRRTLNPSHATSFLTSHGAAALPIRGGGLPAIAGAEARYAGMGHFGRRAIRIAWTPA